VVAVRAERPGEEGAVHALHAARFPSAGEARLVDRLRVAGHAIGLRTAIGLDQFRRGFGLRHHVRWRSIGPQLQRDRLGD